ncbi:MAG: hypothetical protein A2289_10270 [Deltaproteobacteria bacterium RIFOXYA12_FULL_58_15]|nr:MAG: hypothetical protein A2289_10270 [Deltaproteobacteria bacterium RIFOXYA12_FULL_58_15]
MNRVVDGHATSESLQGERIRVVAKHPELAPFEGLMEKLAHDPPPSPGRSVRGDYQGYIELTGTSEYGDLMQLLWKATRGGQGDSLEAKLLLETAAASMDIKVADLTHDLKNAPVSRVRDFPIPTIMAELVGKEPVNKPKWWPHVAEFGDRLDIVTDTYGKLLNKIAPKKLGKSPTGKFLRKVGENIRTWSDEKSSETCKRLRLVHESVKASGLKPRDLKELNDVQRKLVFAATQEIEGVTLDAEQFIIDVRGGAQPWHQALKDWTVERCMGVGETAAAFGEFFELLQDPTAWDRARIAVGSSPGITGGGVLVRYFAGPEVQIYFPNREELKRGIKPKVVSMAVVAGALGPVGFVKGTSSRGNIAAVNLGFLVASHTDFSDEAGVTLLGIAGATIGIDQAFGPNIWLNVNIPLFGFACISGNLRICHPALAPLAGGAKGVAEKGMKAGDAITSALIDGGRALTGRPDEKGIVDGWPSDPRWQGYGKEVDQGRAMQTRAANLMAAFVAVEPEQYTAGLSEKAIKMLGDDASDSVKTHSTIMGFLKETHERLSANIAAMEALADKKLNRKPIKLREARALLMEIKRDRLALDWVDKGLLAKLASDISQTGASAAP